MVAFALKIVLKTVNDDDDGADDDDGNEDDDDDNEQATTSGKLGLRVCGFQRYSQTDGAFQKVNTILITISIILLIIMQVDKYIGRKADEEKFHQLLETFFTVRGQLQVDQDPVYQLQCNAIKW